MTQPIKILLLEDSIYDAELTLHELKHQGVLFEVNHAQNREQFINGLDNKPDIVLADFSLPQFNAIEALGLIKELNYDIPLIVISGTIGEEVAVDMMRRGASDYLMKDRLGRLSRAIESALEGAKLRKENEQYTRQLEESNARFMSIFYNSPISLWEEDFSQVKIALDELTKKGITDLNAYFNENREELIQLTQHCKIISINQATLDLYEAENEEEAIRELSSLFTEQSLKQFQEHVVSFYHGITEYHTQAEHVTLKNNRLIVSVNISISPEYRDGWDRVLVSIVDQTQQHQAQQQVIQSEYLLRSMINSSVDWIFVKNNQHRYLLANKTFTDNFGLSEDEIIGKSDEEIGFTHETAKRFHEDDQRIMESRKPESFYNKNVSLQDGSSLHFSTIKSPLFDSEGNVWGLMGISRDISERLQTESKLHQTQQNYEALFNSLVDGVIVHSKEGEILVSNSIAYKRLGYTQEEFIGLNIRDISAAPSEDENYRERFPRLVEQGHSSFTGEQKCKDGSILPIEVTANLVEFQGEQVVLALVRDISRIIKTEQALKDSEVQYRLLFDTVPDVIILCEFSGAIVHANLTTCELTGYDYGKLTRLTMQELFPGSSALFDSRGIKNDLTQQQNLTFELISKNGITHLLDITAIRTEFNGRTVAMIVGRDQTDRILAERRTAETEGLLRTVLETIPQPIFVYNEDGYYTMVNKNLADLFQTDKENILGKTNIDLAEDGILSLEEAQSFHENAMITLMTREAFFRPLDTFTDPDGIQHTFQIFTVPFKVPDNSMWVVGVGNEITDQIQARTRLESMNEILEQRVEERTQDLDHANIELQQAKEQLETILQYSPDGFLLLDSNLNIQIMNPAFSHITGHKQADSIGKDVRNIISTQNSSLITDSIFEVIETRIPKIIEHVGYQKNGDSFDSLTSFSPIYSGDQLIGIVIGVHDITPQKEVQRMKDAFVSNVSHELRTPITNFICNLELIRMNPEKLDIYLDRLDMEIVQLKNIIEDLLRLSRFDQNATNLAKISFDLNKMCKEFTSLRTPLADQKNLILEFIPQENLPEVNADFGLITQVLSILLTNAINYTHEGDKITIRSHLPNQQHPEMVGFSVSDNGPGIPDEEKEKIFDRFYRGQAALDSNVSGTGLGLPIAFEIISRHDGEIEVTSSGIAGEGTTFTVWLPISE